MTLFSVQDCRSYMPNSLAIEVKKKPSNVHMFANDKVFAQAYYYVTGMHEDIRYRHLRPSPGQPKLEK